MGVSPAVVESMTKGATYVREDVCVRGGERGERGVFEMATCDWLDCSDTDHNRIRLPIYQATLLMFNLPWKYTFSVFTENVWEFALVIF